MRSLLYSVLVATPEVANLVGGPSGPVRVYEAGALGRGGNPAQPDPPYILINALNTRSYPEVRETLPGANSGYFQVWVVATQGDMLVIDNILAAVRDTGLGLVGMVSPSTARCVESIFAGFSPDVPPDRLRLAAGDLVARYATFKLTADK